MKRPKQLRCFVVSTFKTHRAGVGIFSLGGKIRQYHKEPDKMNPMITGEYAKIKEKYLKNTKRAFREL